MINRIKKLTKIFLKDYYQNLNIFNKKNNKLNKKSIYFWLIIIIIACISYISLESILYFNRLGEPILFLKIYLPIIATVSIFQLIMLILLPQFLLLKLIHLCILLIMKILP